MDAFFQDLRYGARLLAKNPGFAAVAMLTLALGIGANAAIFTIVDAVLLTPLPFDDSDELVLITESAPPEFPSMSVAYPNFLDWRERGTTFEIIAAHRDQSFNVTGSGRPELVSGVQVSADFFAMLGVEPRLGRGFTAEEDLPGSAKVVVLSDRFFQRRLGGDPAALGTFLRLDDEPYEIIGVLPPFDYPVYREPTDLWLPIGHFSAEWLESRGSHPGIYVSARLREGVAVEQGRSELETIAAALAEEYPDTNTGNSVNVFPLQARLTRQVRPALLVLGGAVVLVLLIACVNVANLLLARAAARRQEVAVRTALGAGRLRVIRQLLTESLLLGLGGGLLGLGLAWASLRLLLRSLPAGTLPTYQTVTIDGRVLAFTFAVAVATGVLFGLAPALQTVRANLGSGLRDGTRASEGRGGARLRGALVVAEVALALVLLVGAGLFLQSLMRLTDADPGFDPENVLTFDVTLPQSRYPEEAQQAAFFDRLAERVAALPGVVSAAHSLPLLGGWQNGITIEGRPVPKPGEALSTEIFRVSPDLFATLGLRLLHGRLLTAEDRADSTPVAVIDERFAATVWPGESPLGRRFRFGVHDPAAEEETAGDETGDEAHAESGHHPDEEMEPWLEVVGIVNHVKSYGVDEDSRMQAYVPASQNPLPLTEFVVKTAIDPYRLVGAIENEIQALDPDQPLAFVTTLAERVGRNQVPRRLAARLLAVFAALAVLLAALGIYGVLAYSVTRRRHEIGVRMALGADRSAVSRLLISHGLRLAALGTVVGLVLVFVLGPLIESQLFGVEARDPGTLLAIPLALAAVAFLACLLPARRATRVDPVVALRHE